MSDVKKTLQGDQYLVSHSVGPNRSGHRLDRFLAERYRTRSREKLKNTIENGSITILRRGAHHQNVGRLKPSYVLREGDRVQVLTIRRPEPEVCFDYSILFEDDDIVVIQKPANLPVHPAGRYFFNTLLVHLKTNGFKDTLDSERKYFLVHRIDKETSGILVLAKSREACAKLTQQFAQRETEKYYLCIVHGTPSESEFTVDAPIGKVFGSKVGLKMYSKTVEEGGLPSLTHFRVLETRGKFSLLSCFPKTGRQHQIRVHANHAGFPLVGDKIYGISDADALLLIEGYRGKITAHASPEPVDELIQDFGEEISGDDLTDGGPDYEGGQNQKIGPNQEGAEFNEESAYVDDAYAPAEVLERLRKQLILPRHALHAAGLKFVHPFTGKKMKFQSGLPEDLKKFFTDLLPTPLLTDLIDHRF